MKKPVGLCILKSVWKLQGYSRESQFAYGRMAAIPLNGKALQNLWEMHGVKM